jgi:serine/threonine-protein kinase ATR
MAQNSYGNTALLGQHGGAVASGGCPPPSTLAAQLVENISTSTKSSRSDESNELKGLLATIQRIKDHPELLKNNTDRIEHNHMLIYVYCRVALEGIKLDDPFINRAHAHTEAIKAIHFLRFTIKETPSVLLHTNSSGTLLQRGKEPLWIWLLPHLFRFIGHALFEELEGSFEGFLQYLLLLICRTDEIWAIGPVMSLYLRACISGMCFAFTTPWSRYQG